VVLLACRTIELLGEATRELAPAMRRAASRVEKAESEQALFIRFSTAAFLGRLGHGLPAVRSGG
jgi:hypothetical protein